MIAERFCESRADRVTLPSTRRRLPLTIALSRARTATSELAVW